jgi:hypothetical protein
MQAIARAKENRGNAERCPGLKITKSPSQQITKSLSS